MCGWWCDHPQPQRPGVQVVTFCVLQTITPNAWCRHQMCQGIANLCTRQTSLMPQPPKTVGLNTQLLLLLPHSDPALPRRRGQCHQLAGGGRAAGHCRLLRQRQVRPAHAADALGAALLLEVGRGAAGRRPGQLQHGATSRVLKARVAGADVAAGQPGTSNAAGLSHGWLQPQGQLPPACAVQWADTSYYS